MKTNVLKNSAGEILTSKEGKQLTENLLELGDEFVPVINNIYDRSHKAIVKGKEQIITTYSILCKVRDKNKNIVKVDGEEEFFVKLSPSQAKSLKKKLDNGVELNQHLFVTYKYTNDFGDQIGVGMKGEHKPAKSFEDFDNEPKAEFKTPIDLDAIEEEDIPVLEE